MKKKSRMGGYNGKILAFACGFYLSFVIPKSLVAENHVSAAPGITILAQR